MSKNLLKEEISPYLLQHKDNPVHWQPWGEKALEEARSKNKPILLSIGYAACHWCHVMAHESFEDQETADVMNEKFINIKVDREERPDIDKIYMNAIHIMGEQGGWPLTMFLTPDGEPFWGGTYFPKTPQYGRPGFIQVLNQLAEIHQTQPDKISSNCATIRTALTAKTTKDDTLVLSIDILDQAANRLLQQIDFTNGGLKGAPKFPQTIILEFLWRTGIRKNLPEYQDAVTVSLSHMCQGGIYDHLGGGFSRYSVDALWLAPHFEKMLYDNALILDLLIRVWQISAEPLFRRRIEETIEWLKREMITDGGAFSASLDADSEGEEGKFYVWTADEVREILRNDYPTFAQIYDIQDGGNWEGFTILNRLKSLNQDIEHLESQLAENRHTLLKHREQRVRPGLDDKILSDWNGLMIATLTAASTALQQPQWLKMAQKAFDHITKTMIINGSLHHAARLNKVHHLATSDGYANLIRAALALHQATNTTAYLDTAIALNDMLNQHYWDTADNGYFFTADNAEALIVRSKSATDDAVPNANGIMAQNLVRLYLLTGNKDHLDQADRIFTAFTPDLFQNIFGSASLLNAFDMRLDLLSVVVATTGKTTLDNPTIKKVRSSAPPTAALLISDPENDLAKSHPAFGKTAIDNKPTVYICHNNTCSSPLTNSEEITQALIEL